MKGCKDMSQEQWCSEWQTRATKRSEAEGSDQPKEGGGNNVAGKKRLESTAEEEMSVEEP